MNGVHVQLIAAQPGEEPIVDGIPAPASAAEDLIEGGKRGGDLQRLTGLPLIHGEEGEAATRVATIPEALAVLHAEADCRDLPARSGGAGGRVRQHPGVCRDGALEL